MLPLVPKITNVHPKSCKVWDNFISGTKGNTNGNTKDKLVNVRGKEHPTLKQEKHYLIESRITQMSNLNLSQAQGGFIPAFNESKEIITENGLPVKGTSVLVFQGLTMRNVTVYETGEIITFPVMVFACLSDQGSFRNIPTSVNRKTLELLFNAFGLELPIVKTENALAKLAKTAKSLKAFSTKTKLDTVKALKMVEPLRGLAYTGVMERKIGKTGKPYFSLDVVTVESVNDDKNEQVRLQTIEETNPDAVELDLMDEDIKEDLAA